MRVTRWCYTALWKTLPRAVKFPRKFALCPLCPFDTFWKFSQALNTGWGRGGGVSLSIANYS